MEKVHSVLRVALIAVFCFGFFVTPEAYCVKGKGQNDQPSANKKPDNSLFWSVVKWGGIVGAAVLGAGVFSYKMGLFGGNSVSEIAKLPIQFLPEYEETVEQLLKRQQRLYRGVEPQLIQPKRLPMRGEMILPEVPSKITQSDVSGKVTSKASWKRGAGKILTYTAGLLFTTWLGNAFMSSISINPIE